MTVRNGAEMEKAISIREFARRAGCDDKVVRRKIQSGHLPTVDGGKLDPAYLDIDWRSGAPLPAGGADKLTSNADSKGLEEEARLLVAADGEELWSKADAEKVKENYAARLKQLEYDREVGLVVEIDDVVAAVASEYAIVRNRLLGIGSKVAPSVAVLNSAEEIKALIDKEVTRALGALTVDVHGEQDFGKVRESIQKRFGPASEEAAPSPQ